MSSHTPSDNADELAAAWERGVAEGRLHDARVRQYHHWSSISAAPPPPLVNPYRAVNGDPT